MFRIKFIIFTALIAILPSCRPGGGGEFATDGVEAADTLTLHSRLLTIAELPESPATLVDIRSPWDSAAYLARYVLVPRDSVLPENLPDNRTLLRTPLESASVFSAVHTSAMAELGALGALSAVADGRFFLPGDTVRTLLEAGKISDVGAAASPSLEKLIASRAQAVLLSPMQGIQLPALPPKAVAIPMADYLETSPIGRAEWILLIGKLFGKDKEAAGILDKVVNDYCDLQFKAALTSERPLVITETEYGGAWYVPAGDSYMSHIIRDAGARTPWSDTPGTGSLTLNMERVLAEGSEADYWLIRSYGPTTLSSLKAANPLNAKFKAWREGGVYFCDTSEKPIFNDVAFHPERVLADMIAIFHPSALPDHQSRYYSQVR